MNDDDSHLPRGDDYCPTLSPGPGDHFKCWDTDLDLADVNPLIALHDAAFRVTGEAA